MTMLDALVIGKGPAGLAAAAELAQKGLRVGVAGPPGVHWPAVYGAWMDEVEEAGRPGIVERSWPRVFVNAGSGPREVGRTYVRLSNTALAEDLVGRCDRGGVAWTDGEAESATHDAAGSTVTLADGRTVRARVVVDASGHRAKLVRREKSPEPGFQTAVGWTLEGARHPWAADEAVLMDWADGHLPPELRGAFPSFLYAFPLPDGRVFVEETVLARRPAVAYDALRERLRIRLGAMGIEGTPAGGEERVWIPMGGAIPRPQRVVGFGAAAGMVHPATGYSVMRSLLAAPALAEAVAGELGSGRGTPDRAAEAAWRALWPADRRRKQALYRFGLEVLLGMDAAATRAFFDAFFALPSSDWSGYLGDRLPARELAAMMARFFAAAPPELRRKVAFSTLGPASRDLAAALFA
jgi:lycopene cyclase-like protein